MQTINAEARRRFLLRYFLRFCLVVIVPVALLGGSSLFFINNYISDEIESSNRYLLKQTAYINKLIFQTFDTVNLMVSSDINLVNSLVRLSRGDGSFTADDISNVNALHNTLGSMIGSTRYIESVNIRLKDAVYYYTSKRTLARVGDIADDDWMDRVDGAGLPGLRFRIGNPAGGAGKAIFSVYRNLFSVNGIVVVNIDLEKLRADMDELLYYRGQEIHLLDGAETIALTGGRRAVPTEDLDRYASLPPGVYRDSVAGERCLVTVVAMERSVWRLVVLTPFRSLYGLQRRLTLVIAAVIGFCFILGIAIAVRVEAKNYRSIRAILDAVELAEEGKELQLHDARQDVYTYILNRIIQNNILRNYMDTQISKRKYMMEALELKALQFQINPHFLVNTLKTIYWKEVELHGMEAGVCRMMENLLDITGYSLSDTAAAVTLREEIRHSRSFADILIARHPGELEVGWRIEEAAESASCRRLIIQPFIENAFYHGIRASSRRPGRIDVDVSVRDGQVLIAVSDNGAGMDAAEVERIRASLGEPEIPSEHIGICNPHRRIVLAYGEGNGVSIESEPGAGTRVEICFPFAAEVVEPGAGPTEIDPAARGGLV